MGRFNISKGERFKIAKSEGLSKIKVVLDWNSDADLDASTFLCGDEGVILDDAGFVFYNSENREQPFDRVVYGNKRRWMAETRPMSGDGAVLGSIDDRSGASGETMLKLTKNSFVMNSMRLSLKKQLWLLLNLLLMKKVIGSLKL